jgi:hypothetical protein
MRRFSSILVSLLAIGSLAAPLAAQGNRSLELSLFGSGNAPLQDLNGNPNLGFKSGFGGGLGATYVLEKHFALHGDVSYVKSDVNVPSTSCNPQPQCVVGPVGTGAGALNSLSWTHIVAGGDFVLRFPIGDGPVPYFSTGAGIVRFSESGGRTATRMAGRFGTGLQLPLADKFGAFAAVNAQVYDFDQRFFEYFTKVQVDMLFSVGLSIKVF